VPYVDGSARPHLPLVPRDVLVRVAELRIRINGVRTGARHEEVLGDLSASRPRLRDDAARNRLRKVSVEVVGARNAVVCRQGTCGQVIRNARVVEAKVAVTSISAA